MANITRFDPFRELATFDPFRNFEDFFRGPIGGETRDVVVAAIAGVDPTTLEPASGPGSGCPTATDKADRYSALVKNFATFVIESSGFGGLPCTRMPPTRAPTNRRPASAASRRKFTLMLSPRSMDAKHCCTRG